MFAWMVHEIFTGSAAEVKLPKLMGLLPGAPAATETAADTLSATGTRVLAFMRTTLKWTDGLVKSIVCKTGHT